MTKALLMRLAAVVLLLQFLAGCAAFSNTLADVKTGLDAYNAGLATACPQPVHSPLCESARDISAASSVWYDGAVLAEETGAAAKPGLQGVLNDLKDGWEILKTAFAKAPAATVPSELAPLRDEVIPERTVVVPQ